MGADAGAGGRGGPGGRTTGIGAGTPSNPGPNDPGGVGGAFGSPAAAAAGDVAAGVVGAFAGAVAAVSGRSTQAGGPSPTTAPNTAFGPSGVQPEVAPVLLQPVVKTGTAGTTGQGAAAQTSGRRRASSTLLTLGLANTTRKTLLGV